MSKTGYLFKRFIAFLIDISIIGLVLFVFDNYVPIFPNQNSFHAFSLVLYFAYFFYFEGLTGNSTPGKRPFSLEVISKDTPSKSAFAIRALIFSATLSPLLSEMSKGTMFAEAHGLIIMAGALYSFLLLFIGQRPFQLHDQLTNTQVVKMGESWQGIQAPKKIISFVCVSLVVSGGLIYWTKSVNQDLIAISDQQKIELETAISKGIWDHYGIRNSVQIIVIKLKNEYISIAVTVPFSKVSNLAERDFEKVILSLTPEQREYLISKNGVSLYLSSNSAFVNKKLNQDFRPRVWQSILKSESKEAADLNRNILVGEWLGTDEDYERKMIRTDDGKFEFTFKSIKDGNVAKESGEWMVSQNYYSTCTILGKTKICDAYRIKGLTENSMDYQSIQYGKEFRVTKVKK